MTTKRMTRAPKRDPEWQEYERLHRTIVTRADENDRVQRAYDRAARALDELIRAQRDEVAMAMLRFVRALRGVVRAYVAAEPALREIAYPAGQLIRDDVGLLPPVLTYFLAPLGSISALGQSVLMRLLTARVDRDPIARFVLTELQRQMGFTAPNLWNPMPLSKLRTIAAMKRGRGRPAGRSGSTAGWTKMPETAEALGELLREAVIDLRRQGLEITQTNVAACLGVDDRRLRETFAHFGINGPVLLRQIKRELAEKRR